MYIYIRPSRKYLFISESLGNFRKVADGYKNHCGIIFFQKNSYLTPAPGISVATKRQILDKISIFAAISI